MNFFQKLERKLGRYAIPNLMYYIVLLYAAGLALQLFRPQVYWQWLCLDAQAILRGQIWRVVTFLIYPPSGDIFWAVLGMFVYYSLGRTLEQTMGAFRFNVFFLMGILGHVLAALAVWVVFGLPVYLTTGLLNFSIFLAYAICFPDAQFLVLFFFPVKAKWLAVAECALYGYVFLMGNIATRLEVAMSLANVLIFFAMTRGLSRYSPKEIRRRREFSRAVSGAGNSCSAAGRAQGQGPKIIAVTRVRHKCAICGRTELDGADLEFRYCSKCAGNYEYCMDHLYTHRHVTEQADEKNTDEEQNTR